MSEQDQGVATLSSYGAKVCKRCLSQCFAISQLNRAARCGRKTGLPTGKLIYLANSSFLLVIIVQLCNKRRMVRYIAIQFFRLLDRTMIESLSSTFFPSRHSRVVYIIHCICAIMTGDKGTYANQGLDGSSTLGAASRSPPHIRSG